MKNFFLIFALAIAASASTSTLTGTIKDAQGNGISGTLIMTLPVPATDGTTAISSVPVPFRLVNGVITGTTPLYDVLTLQPSGLYYAARAYDTVGNLAFYGNYVVTGGTFNLGSATPTSVTTSNISYLTPAFVNGNNTWSGTNIFSGSLQAATSVFSLDASGNMLLGGTLQFLGTTAGFPMLKRNGTALEVRLADNSNLAPLSVSTLTTSGPAIIGDRITSYRSIPLSANGVATEVAALDLTAQTAAQGASTLFAVTNSGQYRIEWNAKVTTAAGTSSTLGPLSISYVDPDGVTITLTALPAAIPAGTITNAGVTTNSTSTVLMGLPLTINCKAASNISIVSFGYASNAANAMNYNLHIAIESL